MSNPNPPFGDFLELDLMDTTTNDVFSFLFNNDDLNASFVVPSTVPSLDTPMDLSSFNPLSSPDASDAPTPTDICSATTSISTNTSIDTSIIRDTDINSIKKTQQDDIQMLLAMNRQLQEQLRLQQQQQHLLLQEQQRLQEKQLSQSSVTTDTVNAQTSVIDNSAIVAQLITANSLSAMPTTPVVAAVPVSAPKGPKTAAPEPSTTSIATAFAAADAQIAALLSSSKAAIAVATTTATTDTTITPALIGTKRPSPEPAPAAKKIAKIEMGSVQKTSPASTSNASTSSSTTSFNTTLSTATLQFLLQQQTQTPLVPKLFTGKLMPEEIEATLARLLESTKHLLLAPQEPATKEDSPVSDSEEDMDEACEGEKTSGQPVGQTHGLKTQPGIKTDDIPSSSDLKKMTSKERRQLRNKISARNFRVRRKEYIGQLEGQVEQHKTEARHLREAVMVVHEDNKRLKAELEEVKQQLAQTTIANVSATIAPQQAISTPATALSDKSQSLLASILTRTAFNTNAKSNSTLTLSRSESPILTPNLNKDVPNSSSVNGKSWKDKNPVYIHKALVPEICIGDQFQFDPKGAWSKEDEMWDCSWLNLERTPKELSKADINPFLASTVVYELMQTYAAVTLDMMPLLKGEYSPRTLAHGESGASVQDYESDRRMDEAVEWQKQQELCTRVQGLTSTARKTDIDTDELPEEGFRMLFNSSDIAPTPSTPFSCPSASESFLDEDPNMLEWLYESMVACLVGLNVQNTGDQQIYLPFSEVHYA